MKYYVIHLPSIQSKGLNSLHPNKQSSMFLYLPGMILICIKKKNNCTVFIEVDRERIVTL